MDAAFRDHTGADDRPPRARRRIWTFAARGDRGDQRVRRSSGSTRCTQMLGENRQVREDELALARSLEPAYGASPTGRSTSKRVSRGSPTTGVDDRSQRPREGRPNSISSSSSNGDDTVATLEALAVPTNVRRRQGREHAFSKTMTTSPHSPRAARPRRSPPRPRRSARPTRELWSGSADAAVELRAASDRDLHQAVADHLDDRRGQRFSQPTRSPRSPPCRHVRARPPRTTPRTCRAHDVERRTFETALQHALEMSKAEADVYRVVDRALRASVPRPPGGDARRRLRAARTSTRRSRPAAAGSAPDDRSGCGVVSPLDCPATTRGHTLVFPSSTRARRLPLPARPADGDVLRGVRRRSASRARPSASSTPPAPTRRRRQRPTSSYLEITAAACRRAGRACCARSRSSETQARSDPLTGSVEPAQPREPRPRPRSANGVPYTLAYGDLDHFKVLNDTHGHEAGDQALRLFSRVLRDSLRPNDIAAATAARNSSSCCPTATRQRATAVLDRVRERLALALTAGPSRRPSPSASGSPRRSTPTRFDDVVAVADHALLAAKTAGRNRTERVPMAAPPPVPSLQRSERRPERLTGGRDSASRAHEVVDPGPRRAPRRTVRPPDQQSPHARAMRPERFEQLEHARVVGPALSRERVPDVPGEMPVTDRHRCRRRRPRDAGRARSSTVRCPACRATAPRAARRRRARPGRDRRSSRAIARIVAERRPSMPRLRHSAFGQRRQHLRRRREHEVAGTRRGRAVATHEARATSAGPRSWSRVARSWSPPRGRAPCRAGSCAVRASAGATTRRARRSARIRPAGRRARRWRAHGRRPRRGPVPTPCTRTSAPARSTATENVTGPAGECIAWIQVLPAIRLAGS